MGQTQHRTGGISCRDLQWLKALLLNIPGVLILSPVTAPVIDFFVPFWRLMIYITRTSAQIPANNDESVCWGQ